MEKTADGEPMRIGKDANKVVGKYLETFVREAIARANSERTQAEDEAGVKGDGFLEVRMRRRWHRSKLTCGIGRGSGEISSAIATRLLVSKSLYALRTKS